MVMPVLEISITRDFLMTRRQAILLELESIEKLLDISPRTAELRKAAKLNTASQYRVDLQKREEINTE